MIKGLSVEVIVTDDRARRLFPQITPMDYESAVARALASLDASEVETSWSDALVSSQGDTRPFIFTAQDGMLIERRQRVVDAPPETVYAEFAALGGRKGWLAWNRLWRLRGAADRLVGGVGFREGDATRSISASGMPSISGAWKRSKRAAWCACGRR